MDFDFSTEFSNIPQNSCAATKRIMVLLLDGICPALLRLRTKLQSSANNENEDDIVKIKYVYLLCASQIKKCMINFMDIIKMENKHELHLQESRKFIFERLSWCISKLLAVEDNSDKCRHQDIAEQDMDPMFVTPMYFVNWIDYTFEILAKLAEDVYKTDHKNDDSLYEEWKGNMVENVTSLHMCIDELLLSAMTLCKHCLPIDQTILRARCQVVLRETKSLFSELIDEDFSAAVKVTKEKLQLPIRPTNVNMMIDVLKDVLYVLETNTNTALLALLIHCFVDTASPADVLKEHFNCVKGDNRSCQCEDLELQDCKAVKEFDLYNERLHQIGSFAVSCSSDQKRILTLRSCLSSLESLDSHLVPSVTTSPMGCHTKLLSDFWKQEVQEIRNTVFLIVDPIAFVEKCQQRMHDLLLEIKQQETEDYCNLWVAMNMGQMVYDFFSIYREYEPEAVAQYDKLDEKLKDVHTAQKECRTVSKFFTEQGTLIPDSKLGFGRDKVTINTFSTRVRLLYSMVKRVYELIRPKDNDEQFFDEEEELEFKKNLTHVIQCDNKTWLKKAMTTNSHRQTESNFTRSIFARTGLKTSTKNIFLSKLTNHLKLKRGVNQELSFSVETSGLFSGPLNNTMDIPPPMSLLDGKYSLRKFVMSKQCEFSNIRKLDNSAFTELYRQSHENKGQESFMDGNFSLQISEILNQINDLTTIISSSGVRNKGSHSLVRDDTSGHQLVKDISSTSNNSIATQPSNFTTLERINDLDLLETKLNSLRSNFECETHL